VSRNLPLLVALAVLLAASPAQAAKPKVIRPRQTEPAGYEQAAEGRHVRIIHPEAKLAQQSVPVPLGSRFTKAAEPKTDPALEVKQAPAGEMTNYTIKPMEMGSSFHGHDLEAEGTTGGCDCGDPACGEGCQDCGCGEGGCPDGNCPLPEQCGPPCDVCGELFCTCEPYWRHRSYVFGEYLYLLPADADLAHAMQQNGTGGLGTVPAGDVGVLQPDFTSAYRIGFGVALSCEASIGVSYSNFHSHTTDTVVAPPGVGGTVGSLVMHPATINAGSTSQLVTAGYDIDYQLVDVDYRRILSGGCRHAINYLVGVRYGKLEQEFSQLGNFSPPTGTIRTSTNIDFEGVGLRAGLDGEHQLGASCFAVYGKAAIDVLFGEFRSSYTQLDTLSTIVQAQQNWKDMRSLPILDYEVGLQWTSRGGHWRATAGYYTAFWYNTVTTGEFIQAVQGADFVGVGETLSFNGFVSRVEFRF